MDFYFIGYCFTNSLNVQFFNALFTIVLDLLNGLIIFWFKC